MRRLSFALLLALSLSSAFGQAPPPIPALPDTERRTSYSISGTTCICGVGFALFGDSTDYQNWVEVYLNGVLVNFNDATFGWTITSPTGPLATIPRPVTDAVLTFTNAQTGTVQIVGARRPRRVSQFSESRGVAARDLNQAVTDITATLREMWDKSNDVTGRSLLSQPGNTVGLLPVPAACSGKFLGFDITGLNPICTAGGAGSGNVVGPASSTNGHFAIFNGTTGALLADHVIQGTDLPTPGASSLGGVQSLTCSTSNWFNTLSTGGVFGCSQPNFTDLAGSIAAGQIPAGTIVNSMVGASAAIALSKLATQSANTVICNATGGSAVPTACSQAQLTALVNLATTSLPGASPTLPNDGTKFLNGLGVYAAPPSAGQMILLNTLTASASSTLSDTTSLTATYSVYEIVLENVIPATASQTLELQVHSGGSFQATSYIAGANTTTAGAAWAGGATTTFIQLSSGAQNNTSPGISGHIRVHTPSGTTAPKNWIGDTSGNTSTPAAVYIVTSGYWNANGAVDGFQVLFASGNITSGVIKIYGIQ